ncbi:MAG: hypothetical protein WA869_14040 [Alloacidobacterium sp.]
MKKRSAKNRLARKCQQYNGQQVSAPAAQGSQQDKNSVVMTLERGEGEGSAFSSPHQSSFVEKVANPNLAIFAS